MENVENRKLNFIEEIIEDDLSNKKHPRIITRFPPEPNGYLHIGHAKSICLNFGLAKKYNGQCHLRFDDTNPTTEDTEYVDSIRNDVKWLGFDWGKNEFYASDYFDKLYEFAVILIQKGKAYVCEMTAEEMSANRGTPQQPGKESPFRNRSIDENIDLFTRMRNGEFPDGTKSLRAKIDMASPNMHMRDPVLYRIRKVSHHRTGDKWCIYPMYDFAHGQSDYIEGITHSICTLEFEVHRPLYDWFVDNIFEPGYRPRQYEFARLNLSYTVMSKRKLLELVNNHLVNGWDDPRMPTICGLRRRGYTAESIHMFSEKIGVAKRENMIDVSLLEFCIREDLNKRSPRLMGVLNPLKIIITNYPENKIEKIQAINNPENPDAGTREVPFSKTIYIEKDDFMENPPSKYFRLSPGTEVRLRYAYFIKCNEVIKDANGEIVELHCTYDPASKGGNAPDGRKVKATLHWVADAEAIDADVNLYDRLFSVEDPNNTEEGKDWKEYLNPHSLSVVKGKIEPHILSFKSGQTVQFERLGYFCIDPDTTSHRIVINRTVTLKDNWEKVKTAVK